MLHVSKEPPNSKDRVTIEEHAPRQDCHYRELKIESILCVKVNFYAAPISVVQYFNYEFVQVIALPYAQQNEENYTPVFIDLPKFQSLLAHGNTLYRLVRSGIPQFEGKVKVFEEEEYHG